MNQSWRRACTAMVSAMLLTAADDIGHAWLRSEFDHGRPMIALTEVAPHIYHYVVVVGATDREVVVHDPARSAFRVLPWADCERAWTPTGRWMMLVLPSAGLPPGTSATPPQTAGGDTPSAQSPCQELVASGVALAIAGDRERAEQALTAATGFCPRDAAPWLELSTTKTVGDVEPNEPTKAAIVEAVRAYPAKAVSRSV